MCYFFTSNVLLHVGEFETELRSTHNSIQLIACVTSKKLEKYGFPAVLAPFIEDINILARVCNNIRANSIISTFICDLQTGVNIDINGKVHHLRGTVLAVLADTVAAHQLGGFKIGLGFLLRKCRHCMATSDDMQTKVYCCL